VRVNPHYGRFLGTILPLRALTNSYEIYEERFSWFSDFKMLFGEKFS